jgi:hypothetical protein
MRVTRRAGLAIGVVGLGLSVVLSPLTASADAGSRQHGRVVVGHKIDGLTPPEVLAQFWTRLYETPAADLPDCWGMGQTGKVVGIWTETSCTAHRGQVMLIAWGNDCDDTILDPPFRAVGAEAQRRCAVRADHRGTRSLSISIDGGQPVAFLAPRFEFVTHQFTVTPVPDNWAVGTPGLVTHARAHAWIAFIEDLPLGAHSFTVHATFPDGGEFEFTRNVNVVR